MICVIGDVMLDKYTYGIVKRISPEAPIPVLKEVKEEFMLGGAGNVARNIKALGGDVFLIGLAGEEIEKITNLKHFYFNDGRKETIKNRFVSIHFNQQLLRVDYEDTKPISNELAKKIYEKVLELNPRYILISDYAKGVITKELMTLLKKTGKKIFVDPKPKNVLFYKNVFLIKPNLKELGEIVGYEVENEDQFVEKALKDANVIINSNILVTRGEKGASLFFNDKTKHFPTKPKKIYDVSGAGDTFIATLVTYYSLGHSLEDSIKKANIASGIVVGKRGTSIVKKEEIEQQ